MTYMYRAHSSMYIWVWPVFWRVVQYCRVDSIGKRDLTNRSIRWMVNLYWRFVKWSCRLEKCISLAGLRKYLTLIIWSIWHSPSFSLSIRSIRLIRRMVNLHWRSDKWSCRSEKCISLEGLRKYLMLILWQSPCFSLSIWSNCSNCRMVSFIDHPTCGVVDRKSASH